MHVTLKQLITDLRNNSSARIEGFNSSIGSHKKSIHEDLLTEYKWKRYSSLTKPSTVERLWERHWTIKQIQQIRDVQSSQPGKTENIHFEISLLGIICFAKLSITTNVSINTRALWMELAESALDREMSGNTITETRLVKKCLILLSSQRQRSITEEEWRFLAIQCHLNAQGRTLDTETELPVSTII